MSKIIGLDIGTNSIGWAVVDTATNKIVGCGAKIFPDVVPRHAHEHRRFLRTIRRKNYRFARRLLLSLQNKFTELVCQPAFFDKVKKTFPVLIHSLLALLFAGSLLMAVFSAKDFQFWFNLAITILIGWIATKK